MHDVHGGIFITNFAYHFICWTYSSGFEKSCNVLLHLLSVVCYGPAYYSDRLQLIFFTRCKIFCSATWFCRSDCLAFLLCDRFRLSLRYDLSWRLLTLAGCSFLRFFWSLLSRSLFFSLYIFWYTFTWHSLHIGFLAGLPQFSQFMVSLYRVNVYTHRVLLR